MKFSLRTLLLTTTMLPPVIWYAVVVLLPALLSGETSELPDPILAVGILGWVVLYIYLLRRELRRHAADQASLRG
jgi:hypothetical protein